MYERIELPDDPAVALEQLRRSSEENVVLLFKKSPYCGGSARAEGELLHWLDRREEGPPLRVAEVDVVHRRALARGITEALAIKHESPQALIFVNGEVRWHGSHRDLTVETFEREADGKA